MKTSSLRIFTRDSHPIDPRLYGNFVEHMGRCVYTGIYEPGHPRADADGNRTDVLELVRELDVPIVRYPGGNFVSAYKWEDGVGPKEKRPRRLDLAWHSTETNQFGTDEFMKWCKVANTEPMMAVNLGTRGVAEAVSLLEYCNHPGGSEWSDQRIRNGSKEPYGVRVWCLGNEMDGPWQTGHKTAWEYGRLAAETARAMRQFDQKLELVLCGSSSALMPTFMEWERVVLQEAYDAADYISLHCYLGENDARDDEAYLALPLRMEGQIRDTIAACDFVRAKLRHKKTMMLSFDEWNVWGFAGWGAKRANWQEAPALLEQPYTMRDALVFAGMLLTLMRQSPRVRMACVAQLVNIIAPIRTIPGGPAWRQTIFYPLAHASRHGRGLLLETKLDSPDYDSPTWGRVNHIDAVATHNPDDGSITLFALNRSLSDDIQLSVAFDNAVWQPAEHILLASDDLQATNTAADLARVTPRNAQLSAPGADITLPRLSWNVVRFKPAG